MKQGMVMWRWEEEGVRRMDNRGNIMETEPEAKNAR